MLTHLPNVALEIKVVDTSPVALRPNGHVHTSSTTQLLLAPRMSCIPPLGARLDKNFSRQKEKSCAFDA